MCFIQYVCRVPLRMTDEMCEIGDYAIHGEEPYTFEYYNRNQRRAVAGFEHQGPTDAEKALREVRRSHERQGFPGGGGGSDDGGGVLIKGRDPEGGEGTSEEVTPTKESKQE